MAQVLLLLEGIVERVRVDDAHFGAVVLLLVEGNGLVAVGRDLLNVSYAHGGSMGMRVGDIAFNISARPGFPKLQAHSTVPAFFGDTKNIPCTYFHLPLSRATFANSLVT